MPGCLRNSKKASVAGMKLVRDGSTRKTIKTWKEIGSIFHRTLLATVRTFCHHNGSQWRSEQRNVQLTCIWIDYWSYHVENRLGERAEIEKPVRKLLQKCRWKMMWLGPDGRSEIWEMAGFWIYLEGRTDLANRLDVWYQEKDEKFPKVFGQFGPSSFSSH